MGRSWGAHISADDRHPAPLFNVDVFQNLATPSQTAAPLRRFHHGLRLFIQKLLGINFRNMDWFIYCLPQHCGGNHFTIPADKANAAYVGAHISMFSTHLNAMAHWPNFQS